VAERGKARTWILTLVHRRAVDLVRREQSRRTEPLKDQPEAGGRTAHEEAWLRLERTRVQQALKRLPDQQREAIELAYYGGFTQSELADRLGQPLGTIKSRMCLGLGRLRELRGDPRLEMSGTSTLRASRAAPPPSTRRSARRTLPLSASARAVAKS